MADFMNVDNAKSYKTEANLKTALVKYGFDSDFHVIVCNRAGRFTAVFPLSNIKGGYMGRYATRGFLTIG